MKYKINLRKLVCFTFCLVFVFATYIFYQNWSFIGFRDGYVSELDKINVQLYPVYISVSAIFSIFFLYFGVTTKESKREIKILQLGITLAFIFFVAIVVANYFLNMNFNHGQGG